VRAQDGENLYGRAEVLLCEVISELVPQGVLVPGYENNSDWPFLVLTEYGRNVIEEGRATPADPEGFVERFQEVCPQATDDTILYPTFRTLNSPFEVFFRHFERRRHCNCLAGSDFAQSIAFLDNSGY
jgi:hypothetical protein